MRRCSGQTDLVIGLNPSHGWHRFPGSSRCLERGYHPPHEHGKNLGVPIRTSAKTWQHVSTYSSLPPQFYRLGFCCQSLNSNEKKIMLLWSLKTFVIPKFKKKKKKLNNSTYLKNIYNL